MVSNCFINSFQIKEIEIRYDHICREGEVCDITLPNNLSMRGPVYVYYRMSNFYQNHRRYVNILLLISIRLTHNSYVKSRNDAQLRGVAVNNLEHLRSCMPFASINGSSDPNMFYFPCGLIAHYVFNDTFILKNETGFVHLRKDGIAWPSDVSHKFKNPPPDTDGVRVVPDLTDEDFIVWMRTAGLPDFRKLYRIIDEDLDGDYTVTIFNNFPVQAFSGRKYLVLSEMSWLGGKNPFIGIAYMAVGGLCILLAVLFLIKHLISGRPLGDLSYLEWNRKGHMVH